MRALLLLIAFVGVPLLEVFVLIQVGQEIGALWAILLIIGISVAGAWLVRAQGRRAWAELITAIRAGRLPDTELLNAALVLVGGALLLTPGFVTDALGLLLMVPVTRPVFRRVVTWAIGRQMAKRVESLRATGRMGPAGASPSPGGTGAGTGESGPVIVGEVIEPERSEDRPGKE